MKSIPPKIRGFSFATTAIVSLLSLSAQAQTVIPSDNALPAGSAVTSKPGFIMRVHQITTSQPNTIARAEAQIAGLLGNNIADPNVPGPASDVALPPNPSTAPIEFIVPTVVNINQFPGDAGNFPADDQMPGVPGLESGTDNIAIEVLTWLELPAGEIVMGVNSDDGFRVSIGGGSPVDKFATNVGEYNSSRGAADSIFRFQINQAGLYAARLIYYEGASEASLEWFTQKADGTKVLINDTDNGGVKAYQAVTGGSAGALLTKMFPGIDQTGIAPNATLELELTDGPAAVDPATVKLSLDGSVVNATATKTGNKTAVKFTPSSLYASGSSHNLSLSYAEGGVTRTRNWGFTVANYGTLTAASKVTPDTSKPGFVWNVFANLFNQATTNQRAEDALAGLLKDTDGNLLVNMADPSARGAAIAAAAAPVPDNAPIKFEIAGVINLTQSADDEADNQNGNFTPDQQMPGIPAYDGTDGIAAEILTYIELPAGVITMGINSDDGFRTTAGNPLDAFGAILLGEYDGGRGASDSIFTFVVQEAGVYAFRTLWQEGAGGANIEWFTVKADGTKVLVNDVAKGGFKAYRALVGGTNPYIKSVSPSPVPRQVNQTSSTLTLILADGSNPVDDNSVALKVDGKPVTVNKDRQGKTLTVTYDPNTLQIPGDIKTGEITFKDSTGAYTRTQTWSFRNLKKLILPNPAVTEDFDSYEEGTVPTGWQAINFTTTGSEGEDLDNFSSDSYKGWIVVSRDRLEAMKSRIFNVAPGQFVNGEEVTSLAEGNVLYAESDARGGDQVQFITSKPFNLSALTNVVLSFSSLYEQNQDNIGAVEYSVDGGNSWLPVVYFIDVADSGGDIKYKADGSVDAIATLTGPNADTASWVENGVQKGDKYGDGLLAPITAALGDYIVPRINDDNTIDKRVEVFRLDQAGGKSDVRLRFAQLGTGSWYFGVDRIAFYEGPAGATPPVGDARLAIATADGASIRVSWTGTGTLETADAINGTWTAAPSQSNPQNVTPSGTAKFFRVRR